MSNYPQLSLLSAYLSTRNRATLSIYPYILAILYLRSFVPLLVAFFLDENVESMTGECVVAVAITQVH